MTIQAVFFDMGGTIETFSYSKELRLEKTPGIQSLLISAGIDLGLNNQQLLEILNSGLKDYHDWSLKSLTELKSTKVWNDYILKNFSFDKQALDLVSEDLMFFIETRFYYREMRHEIPEVLERIKNLDLKIGLISNVNSRGQVPFNLEKYNIKQYFDPIVISSEYGRRKPDPAIFHYAARLANVPTSECIYVGDRISRDIEGSKRAGFKLAVQIFHDFDHGETDFGPDPDVKIKNMTELIDIIDAENSKTVSINSSKKMEGNNIKAFLFDAGDILYFRPDKLCKFYDFLDEVGIDKEVVKCEEGKILKQKAFNGEINRMQYQEALLGLYGISDPDEINRGKLVLEYEDNNIEFFDGVQETLLQLKTEGLYLGVITDTAASTHMKMKWFEKGGFGHVWDTFISSKEIGVQKPHPKIYLAALNQLGIKANQSIFVGHDANEIKGAKAIGMTTVAFNYSDDVVADYYVNNFSDLLKLSVLDTNFQKAG
jgi:HAD superfamily hydrolase (TIGR01549 family)/HAD superfamily hydrolase (TIGR01509 family)